jgi:hypothetical protein
MCLCLAAVKKLVCFIQSPHRRILDAGLWNIEWSISMLVDNYAAAMPFRALGMRPQ